MDGASVVRTPIPHNAVLHDMPFAFGVVVSQLHRHNIADIGHRRNSHNVRDIQVLGVAIGFNRNLCSLSTLVIGHSNRTKAA